MFLKAIVVNTNDFAATGKIRVRIASKYLGQIPWDLTTNIAFIKEGVIKDQFGQLKHSDYEVSVYTPFGVGKGCSMYYLPKVNSVGLVAPIGAIGSDEYVWMGGIYETSIDTSKGMIPGINIPTDREDDEENFGITNGVINLERDNAFVWRFKSTTMPRSYENLDQSGYLFDWNYRPTENLIVADDFKFKICHFSDYKGKKPSNSQTFFMGSEMGKTDKGEIFKNSNYIKLENTKIEEDGKIRSSVLILDEDKSILASQHQKNEILNSMIMDENGISINTEVGGKIARIRQTKKGIEIKFQETSIQINEKDVSVIAEGTVYIDAKAIRLGDTDQKIVTTTSAFDTFKVADGILLSTSKKAYA